MGCHPEGPGQAQKVAHVNLINKVKCKVLHLGQGNPGYQSRLRDEQIHSSPAEKDLGVLVDARLDVSQQCAFADLYPGLLKKQHDWQVQGGDFPSLLHCGDTAEFCVQFPGPQHRKVKEKVQRKVMEQVQRRPQKLSESHRSCEHRLRELGLLSLEKGRFLLLPFNT
ncbi:hypothetical protein DUI87_05908 [Hirundo rustica rustica]|uniref:Uncharacterized protein n=1 Tax=Hirundo rustica rustica TaxID=333673 RepID=A0A3M0LDV7_HIRRU|nr:hypothetical protein DUI87_05908 [Hirundo rustica rustica]